MDSNVEMLEKAMESMKKLGAKLEARVKMVDTNVEYIRKRMDIMMSIIQNLNQIKVLGEGPSRNQPPSERPSSADEERLEDPEVEPISIDHVDSDNQQLF